MIADLTGLAIDLKWSKVVDVPLYPHVVSIYAFVA